MIVSRLASSQDLTPLSFREWSSSAFQQVSHLAHSALDFTSSVLHDFGRVSSCAGEWIEDHSFCSFRVKQSAHRVREFANRFNLFGSFCDAYSSSESFLRKEISTFSEGVEALGSCLGSSLDFLCRLDDFEFVKLSQAKPYLGGLGGVADFSVAVSELNELVRSPDFGSSWIRSGLKLAKAISFLALAVLGTIASYFTSFVSRHPTFSFYVLVGSTAFLSFKVANIFYEKLVPSISV